MTRAAAQHPDGRMSVIEACEGAITVSDNTAANALHLIGGLVKMTDYFGSLGGRVTRLDRAGRGAGRTSIRAELISTDATNASQVTGVVWFSVLLISGRYGDNPYPGARSISGSQP